MSTEGLVTSFSPHNDDRIYVDGMPYTVQNADRPWSISNPDPYTLRFELRPGDVWPERSVVQGADSDFRRELLCGRQGRGRLIRVHG